MVKFEMGFILHNSENMVIQSREILQTFVCWGESLCPQHTNVCKINKVVIVIIIATLRNYIFAILQYMNLKSSQFTKYKVLFLALSMDVC